jgi:hypothetical protein
MCPDDINSVAEWLNTQPEKLNFRKEILPISLFEPQIHECLSTYLEFPEDEDRTHQILTRLRGGEAPYPIFVEDNDKTLFVLEGRHRIVAFYQHGLTEVEVMFASVIK